MELSLVTNPTSVSVGTAREPNYCVGHDFLDMVARYRRP